MQHEWLNRERSLKEQVHRALDAQDWGNVHRLASALVDVYTALESEPLADPSALERWRGLRTQWQGYAQRFSALAAEAPPATAPAWVTPAQPADPARAARVLGLGGSASDRHTGQQPGKSPHGQAGKAAREPDDDDGKSPTWLLKERPTVRFDDIIGLNDLKQRVRRFVVKFKHPEEVAKWKGAKLGDRMILYGPPGTGKTMFAKAVAHEIDADFFLVKGANLLDKWVGESQKNVSRLFEAVRGSKRAVVFLDEIDGILSSRGSSSTVRDGVVSEFLQEMEGISSPNSSVLFIGATNLPKELDDAVVSRFGAMFYVPLPDKASRLALLQRAVAGFPYGLDPDLSLEQLAEELEGHSMRSVQRFLDELVDAGILNSAEGTPRPVNRADVEMALRSLPPPMSQRELAMYRKLGHS